MNEESPRLQERLAQIERAIAATRAALSNLDSDQLAAALAPLQQQRAEIQAQIEGSGW